MICFFFKQKTAYEIKECDWSSDVCSSDLLWHTYTMRFTGLHLLTNSQAAFHKVQVELHNPWALAFYVVGITAASWHFGYGLFLFCAKWGIAVSEKSRKWASRIGIAVALVFIAIGLITVRAFFRPGPAYNPPSSTWEQPAENSGTK